MPYSFIVLYGGATAIRSSMHSLPGDGAGIGGQQEHFFAAGATGGDHAFAEAEFHLPRGEVCDADHQPADEIVRLVRFLDAGEHGARVVAAEAERELQELLGVGNVGGGDDASDAEVDLGKVVDGAHGRERFGGEGGAVVGPLWGVPAR